MGNATPATPAQAGAAGATAPTTPATPANAAGANNGEASPAVSAPPAWDSLNWDEAPLDKIPWDKIGDKVPLDKLSSAQKMQSTLRKQIAERETAYQRAQADLAAERKRLEQVMNMVKAQGPQYQQQIGQIEAQAEQARLAAELDRYRQQEALQAMSEDFGVPLDLIQQHGPQDAYGLMRSVVDYHKSSAQTGMLEMQRQMQELQKKFDALTSVGTDPVANADRAAMPSTNNLQARYDELAGKGDGPGAERVAREAENAGIELDTVTIWRDKWRR